ncbi:MAG: glycosyltransferase family 2 protein [Christensenellales bacterium]|jgi:GT2 family glycosyltransferase
MLTVCIVSHNDQATIDKAVRGILQHMPVDGRLLIVDNASSDNTLEIVGKIPQIQLIRLDKNLGFGSGHNAALPYLNAKYHAIINPDIEVKDDVLQQICDYMDEHPDVAMVQPMVYFPDGQAQHHGKKDPTFLDLFIRLFFPGRFHKRQARYLRLDADYSKPFAVDVASGCFMVVRTELFKRIGGFDRRFFLYFEDNDLSRRIRQHGRIMHVPFGHVVHHWNRSSRRSWKSLLIMLSSAFRYFAKWGPGSRRGKDT